VKTRIVLVSPAPSGSWTGNRVTADRWAAFLRGLGHHVEKTREYRGDHRPADLLVALHARKSYASIARFRGEHPDAPLVVALTGTDLYRDLRRSVRARRSLQLASRLILLQPEGLAELPALLRAKARVIIQSAVAPQLRPRASSGLFDVCVLAHLRAIKDPLRAGLAARNLPASSRIRVLHLGAALDAGWAARARAEAARNPRYRWLGGVPRARALRILARSRLLVLSSRMEGGANVVSEALACGVPVLSSRIPGSIGLLGRRYPGYYTPGDSAALATLLHRCETEPRFYGQLQAACRRLAPLVDPARERRSWALLLAGLRR
jgi:putative glycosyltransferase (TIGR04348 family)